MQTRSAMYSTLASAIGFEKVLRVQKGFPRPVEFLEFEELLDRENLGLQLELKQLPQRMVRPYLYTTGSFKRRLILKQQFTIEKGYYDPVYNTPYSEPDGLRVSIIALCSSTAQNY